MVGMTILIVAVPILGEARAVPAVLAVPATLGCQQKLLSAMLDGLRDPGRPRHRSRWPAIPLVHRPWVPEMARGLAHQMTDRVMGPYRRRPCLAVQRWRSASAGLLRDVLLVTARRPAVPTRTVFGHTRFRHRANEEAVRRGQCVLNPVKIAV